MTSCNIKYCLLIPIVLVLCLTVGYAESNTDYENHWAKYAIDKWASDNIITLDSGMFRPKDPITRGEFAYFINSAFGLKKESDSPFVDVNNDYKYYRDTLIAKSFGYMTGYPDGSFRPEQQISRQEVAVILYKVVSPREGSLTVLNCFKDCKNIKEWSKLPFASLISKGYMHGYEDGTLRLSASITRAEALVIIYNIINDLEKLPFSSDATLKHFEIDFGPEKYPIAFSSSKNNNALLKNPTPSILAMSRQSISDLKLPYPERLNIIIPKDVESPTITVAEPADPKAHIEILQATKETNTAQIIVTAETGDQKTYSIIFERSHVTLNQIQLELKKMKEQAEEWKEIMDKLYN